MDKHLFSLLFILTTLLSAKTTFVGTDCLATSSGWPPNAYEILQITLEITSDDLDARAIYCDLSLPSGRTIGTYSADISENGIAVISFATTTLYYYGEEGAFSLDRMRILTPEGFAAIPGSYTTQNYLRRQFRPMCQSTLLSCDNGLTVNLEETELSLTFSCPNASSTLPEFFFREGCIFDGYGIAIDTILDDISFEEGATNLFNTPTYTGYDVSRQAFEELSSIGDRDCDLDPGETLTLRAPIQWNALEDGTDNPEEFVYLLLFYHLKNQEFIDQDAIVIHPFDTNENLQISKTELDGGMELWLQGKAKPQFLLEAVDLCDATTYEYDYTTGHYTPYWP